MADSLLMANHTKVSRKKRQHAAIHFKLPEDHYLLITTERQVLSWNNEGLSEILYQKDGGIVATKQASNDTGFLAVADGLVVMLRKKNGTSSKSWTLRGNYDHVTRMKFTNKSEELLYSTSLLNSIVQYSTDKNEIVGYSCTHPSSPSTFAVSMNSQHLVTASSDPPTLFLEDLRSPSPPILVRPHASDSYVTVAEFHPYREDIFLLAYEDGTISVHTVSRILLMRGTANGSDGSLGHLSRTHHHRGQYGSTIIAAAFMAAYKLRTVSITVDGRCRIVDFDRGVTILRSWAVKFPCTCLSVAPYQSRAVEDAGSWLSHEPGGSPVESDGGHIIAVGCSDGYVMFYNELGLLMGSKLFDGDRGPVIDLEWISEAKRTPSIQTEDVPRESSIADVKWAFTSSQMSNYGGGSPPMAQTPKEMPKPRRHTVSETPRFRPARSPRKSLPKPPRVHVYQHLDNPDNPEISHSPEVPDSHGIPDSPEVPDSPDIPGAWISSSDSISTVYTARTTQKEPVELATSDFKPTLPSARIPETLTPRKNLFPDSTSTVLPNAISSRDDTRLKRKIPALRKRNQDDVAVPLSSPRLNNVSDEAKVRKQMKGKSKDVPPIISKRTSSSIQPDGAGSYETGATSPETATTAKWRTPELASPIITPRPQPPATPPQSPTQSSLVKSTNSVDIPSLASLAQRLRISSSVADDWVAENEYLESPDSRHIALLSFTTAPPMNNTSSPESNKPLPLPPSPSADLFHDLDDLFLVSNSLLPPSAELSPFMKPLPDLPTFDNSKHVNTFDASLFSCDAQFRHCRCECDCAEVVREEMALLRGEVASLRKAIWCLGSGTGWGRLVQAGDGHELVELEVPSGEDMDGGGAAAATGDSNEGVTGDGVEEDIREDGGLREESSGTARGEDEAEWAKTELEWATFEKVE